MKLLSRAATLGSAGAMIMTMAQCDGNNDDSCGVDSVTVSAPCGFVSITTSCGTPICNASFCSFGPITAACEMVLVLGDQTSHTIYISADGCSFESFTASPSSVNLASKTCQPGVLSSDSGSYDAQADVDAAVNPFAD